MNIDDLNDKFAIEGEIGFAELEGDLVFAMIANKYADANISLYGAQITDFRPVGTMDILWMSPLSKFEEGNAIRGGIPVCFPWFGPHEMDGTMPQHGFARLMYWEVAETGSTETGESMIRLQIHSSDETQKYWPHDFCAEIIYIIGTSLSVTLKITNTSSEPLEYTSALHSYFSLSSIENITIEGLENTHYQNQLDGRDYIQETPLLKITEAVTHHYYNTESSCIINDPVFNRKIRIDKTGSKNTTVWNPWVEASEEMTDMPDDGYLTFICLETVNKINDVIRLNPGEKHETSAVISIAH